MNLSMLNSKIFKSANLLLLLCFLLVTLTNSNPELENQSKLSLSQNEYLHNVNYVASSQVLFSADIKLLENRLSTSQFHCINSLDFAGAAYSNFHIGNRLQILEGLHFAHKHNILLIMIFPFHSFW